MTYILHTSDQFQLRTDTTADKRCRVSDIFRKLSFDTIKILRKYKKKQTDGKKIHSYITQHNVTNLDENSVLNTIKPLLKENLLKTHQQRKEIHIT